MGCGSSNASSKDKNADSIKEIQKQINEEEKKNEDDENKKDINEKERSEKEELNEEVENNKEKDDKEKSIISKNAPMKNIKRFRGFDGNTLEDDIPEEVDGVKLKATTKDYVQDDPYHGVLVEVELLKLLKFSFSEMDMARMIITATNQNLNKAKNEGTEKKKVRLNKSQVIRASEIIVERIKSYQAKIQDEFDRSKPINDPLLNDILIKVGLKDLSDKLLNKPCFKDIGTKKSELQKALLYGGKGDNSFKVMAIELI